MSSAKTGKGHLSLKKLTIRTSVRAGKPEGYPSGTWPPGQKNRPAPHFPPGGGGD
jgi:hypothetical protein